MRDPVELRERAGIRGDPNRDQYFLEDERVLDRIITYADDAELSLDHVLEIGPGAGALTARLVEAGDRVTAIERDRELVTFLQREFGLEIENDRLTVLAGDALEVDLPDFSACISNLPYGAASELIFRVLPVGRPLLVMVQREFGERMAADPGTDEYGRLSVTTQHYGTVSVREIVPPGAFTPSPPVESAIVQVLPGEPAYDLVDEERFFDVVRALFTQRRKTVRNAIRNTGHISGIDATDAVVASLSEEILSLRPDALTPNQFAAITNAAVEQME